MFFVKFFIVKIIFLILKKNKMQKVLVFVGVLLIPCAVGKDLITVEKSNSKTFEFKAVSSDKKTVITYKNLFPLEFVMNKKHFSQPHISNKKKEKQRRERSLKPKNESGKCIGQKSKPQIVRNDKFKNILRINEKVHLVRNKTIELLKSGLRILRAEENYTKNGSKSIFRANDTLLEKILSSAVSERSVFLSTDDYKLPGDIYQGKVSLSVNHTLFSLAERSMCREQTKQQNKKQKKSFNKNYEYERDFSVNRANGSSDVYETVGILFKQIKKAFKNFRNCSNKNCSGDENAHFVDSCQKWLNCKKALRGASSGSNNGLPSCPCIYPSTVFYDEMIWDEKQIKYFRWKDASNESERLDIYKPGAAYCIRSLLTQESNSLSSQQCCYDRSLQLLTRGSGAGTINFISPDISKKLHYIVDILPWRLCKGDFTRYNTARNANNGNNCPENPNEEEYQLQLKLTKIF